MNSATKKGIGFQGELIIDIPKIAITKCQKLPLINALFIEKMGYYPRALHHYHQRPGGTLLVIIIYCTNGKGWIQHKKNKIHIEAGHLYLIPANVPHSYGADADDPWTIYWFHLHGKSRNETLAAIAGNKHKEISGVQVNFSQKRNAIFDEIARTFQKGYSTSNLLLANLLLPSYLASFIMPEHFSDASATPQPLGSTNKAIAFMQQNLSSTLTLERIAASAHLSVSFFSRKFKHDTGYAPIEYFNHLRIQKACQLLHFENARINEVASQIGIDDPFYFSRLFKQQMGTSPAAYRRNKR